SRCSPSQLVNCREALTSSGGPLPDLGSPLLSLPRAAAPLRSAPAAGSAGNTTTPDDSISFAKLVSSRSAVIFRGARARRGGHRKASLPPCDYKASLWRLSPSARGGNVGPERAFAVPAFVNIRASCRQTFT